MISQVWHFRMRHLLLSAVCVAATDSNATFGALADRVEWTRVNDKASYDWPNSTLRHFAPAEAMDLVRGRHVLVLGNSVARHVVVALHMLIGGRAPRPRRRSTALWWCRSARRRREAFPRAPSQLSGAKRKHDEEEEAEPEEEMADIELERLRNIERNKEILRSLGLA